MPLTKTKKTEKYTYAIWKIEENSDHLLKLLKPNKYELKLIKNITNQKRKDQSIAAKILLNYILEKKTTVFYNGKAPYCKEFSNISITHSDNYAAVLLSEKKIGIDLQKEEQKIIMLKNKFLSKKNEKNNYSTEDLHFIWTAKEAIYKTLNEFNCSIKKNIFIAENKKTGYFINEYKKIEYNLESTKIYNLYLTIAIKKHEKNK